MTVGEGIALAAGLVGVVSSVVTPGIIVGKYLGGILTTQAGFAADHGRHYESAKAQGGRLEQIVVMLAELRGELRARGMVGDFSGRVRQGSPVGNDE